MYSPAYAKRQNSTFEDRLIKAENDLSLILKAKQGRKKLKTKAEVDSAVTQILTQHPNTG